MIRIGSLEGDGLVFIADRELVIGSNNLSTTFSGPIAGSQPGYALTKVGTGTLTLTAPSTYTGFTTVNDGALVRANTTGSATGTSTILLKSGTLGGSGSVDGNITVGTAGTGIPAYLAPAISSREVCSFTIRGSLFISGDGVYNCKLNTRQAVTDNVIVNGVTIVHGAEFYLTPVRRDVLALGTTFTVMSNTAVTPIEGAFVNLPDGDAIRVDKNRFQANYHGGDGNDLTLTVVE